MTTKQIQRKQSNSKWYNEDRSEEFIKMAAEFKNKTVEEISNELEAGEKIYFDSDWYAQIRIKPEPKKTVTPKIEIEMIKCDCGCSVPKNCVMSASLGTSCPDCYDDMSD